VKRFVVDCLISGLAGGLLSHVAAAACSKVERGRSSLPMHSVSHIAWGDAPDAHQGQNRVDWFVGAGLHHGASIFWAAFFEGFFGKDAEKSTASAVVGGATIAAAAYVTDYHVVSERFAPGFEAHVSNRSMFAIYAALGVGLAASARLRGLYRHQVENRDERDERGNAERRPDTVIAPVERR